MPEYWAQVRCKTVKTQETELQWIAFSLPHEVVHTITRLSIIEKLLATDGMDPLTKEHLQFCEHEAQCKLLGLGLWADGTPCNWDRTQSLDCVQVVAALQELRVAEAGVSHCLWSEAMTDLAP